MKRLLSLLLFIAPFNCFGQHEEYTIHSNGLIYSDTTMKQLHNIVDSLNLKFKACDPWKQYFTLSQTRAHYINMDSGDVRSAYKEIKAGISYAEFRKKYPTASIDEHQIVVRSTGVHEYGEKKGKPYAAFHSLSFEPYGGYYLEFADTSLGTKELAGKFIVDYEEKDHEGKTSFSAFYFPEPFRSPVLPDEYARMVQYVDCMVDTSQSIFFKEANSESFWDIEEIQKQRKPKTPAYDALDAFVSTSLERFLTKSKDEWFYVMRRDSNAEKRLNEIALTTTFKTLLSAACKEAIEKNTRNQPLEYLADNFGEPGTALHLKRMRVVVGGCSQDQAPRYHALAIARLSAQTIKWEIFLRAHLDIMNDNFQRVSDGSYAWGQRKTYIRELEELDLDIEKLMFGMCLRISNPSGTHYYGSVSRIGRALAEYRDRSALEAKMAAMISSPTLDLYNRVMIYFLYRNYQYYRNENKVTQNDPALANAIESFPESVRLQISKAEKK